MKKYLEDLEIGESKVKLSEDEIKAILTEHGKSVNAEKEKVRTELNTEIETYKNQLKDANNEIKSYKDMDIEGIKKSAEDWETKYNDLVKTQNEAKEKSIREERTNAFFNGVEFASESAKAGVIAQFNEKDFKYDEKEQKFQGASEWLEELKKNDVGAFKSDVANPKFTTSVTPPANSSTNDEIRKAMGLEINKK